MIARGKARREESSVVTAETAEALCRVDGVYERRSPAISGNRYASGFNELMPKNIANPTVDRRRLLHHAHVVFTNRDSIPRDPPAARGWRPPSTK